METRIIIGRIAIQMMPMYIPATKSICYRCQRTGRRKLLLLKIVVGCGLTDMMLTANKGHVNHNCSHQNLDSMDSVKICATISCSRLCINYW